MKRKIDEASVLRRVPEGAVLPAKFAGFVAAAGAQDPNVHGWFELRWRAPQDFELTKAAATTLVPFMRLGDGGVVAFWFATARVPAVVHFDSEGGRRVVAANFDDFLRRCAQHKTKVDDLDEADQPAWSRRGGGRALPSLTTLQKQFGVWCAAHSALQPATVSASSERLRKQLHAVARTMIRDGLSKVHTPRSYWSMSYAFKRTATEVAVTYLDYGKYYPVPSTYTLAPLVGAMLALCKNRKLQRGEFEITKDGLVSVERDRQLLLEPAT
ncbi:MAG TPA: hypothetical protein PLF40_04045 [Kofleriaceae bacterium]|nr:hypothetical protein [Kofleriaceae bacterium]